jgi:hypothetical protein
MSGAGRRLRGHHPRDVRRRLLAWILVTPVAAAGVLATHALAYRLTGTHPGPVHEYLAHVPQVVFVLASLAVVGLAFQERSLSRFSAWWVAPLQRGALVLVDEVVGVVDNDLDARHCASRSRAEAVHEPRNSRDLETSDRADDVRPGSSLLELRGKPAGEKRRCTCLEHLTRYVGRRLGHLGARSIHQDERQLRIAARNGCDPRVVVDAGQQHGIVALSRDQAENVRKALTDRR